MKRIYKASKNKEFSLIDIRQAEFDQRRKDYLQHAHDQDSMLNERSKNNYTTTRLNLSLTK
tara:strand:- start:60 stop:242 length:183 start_codon:yes stop_codon:yes gene_type:complete